MLCGRGAGRASNIKCVMAVPAVTKSRWSLGFWKRVNRPVLKFIVVEWPWLSADPICVHGAACSEVRVGPCSCRLQLNAVRK